MLLGTTNWYMISLMNSITLAVVIDAASFTLIHFVNLTTATKIFLFITFFCLGQNGGVVA
jgi:hypothetical protein